MSSSHTLPVESKVPVKPSAHERWNESHATWWYDRSNGIGGFHRLAHQPNSGTAHVWHNLMGPEGSFRRVSIVVPYEPSMRHDGGYRSEELLMRYDEGGPAITSYYPDGGAELKFVDFYPAVETYSMKGYQGTYVAGNDLAEAHFEASGSVRGVVKLGGRHYDIEAIGHRDHSWGPRNLVGVQSSNWLTGTIGPELSFSMAKFVLRDQPPGMLGYLAEGEKIHVLEALDFTFEVEFDSVTLRGALASATFSNGRTCEMHFSQPLKAPIVSIEGWMATETIFALTVDGRQGVGLCERAFNTTGGDLQPAFTVGALAHEGFLANHL